MSTSPWTRSALALLLCAATLLAQPQKPQDPPCAIQAALAGVDEATRTFHEHVTFLANPFLGGRLPGTQGMVITRDYVEQHLKAAGLQPAFGPEGQKSFRQPFKIGARNAVTGQRLAIGDRDLVAGRDYRALSEGGAGAAKGQVVFAGYGIAEGPEGWQGFVEGDSLAGKIVLVLRFEPLNADGNFLWGRDGDTSRYGRLDRKLRDLAAREPAAILIANPPGAQDVRATTLMESGSGRGRRNSSIPVIAISNQLASELVKSGDPEQRTFEALRQLADKGRVIVPLSIEADLGVELSEEALMAENVAGIVPGRGALADQIVVVGGHIDHLGMGSFGSRDPRYAGKKVHPGADDNATGTAGVIMMAATLKKLYDTLPADQPARTVLFIGFDAEEQGLLGAEAYLKDPIRPREAHTLMINFDMIGRLTENKIAVQGLDSAKGLAELLAPALERTTLEVVKQRIIPASDHWPFYSAKIPVLFSICHSINDHPDYHTSNDTADRINFVDGTKAIRFYDDMLALIALHQGELPFDPGAGPGTRRNR